MALPPRTDPSLHVCRGQVSVTDATAAKGAIVELVAAYALERFMTASP